MKVYMIIASMEFKKRTTLTQSFYFEKIKERNNAEKDLLRSGFEILRMTLNFDNTDELVRFLNRT